MPDLHKAYLANVESRIAGAKVSQLAMAAPLESGGSSSQKARAAAPVPDPKEEAKEMPNQKLGLLNALLAVGALRPAISILSKFPWMVDAYPQIADLMLRVLKHSIQPLYATLPNALDKLTSFGKPRARYGATGLVPAPERRPQLTLTAPTPPSTSAIEFVFFFPDWVQFVPRCTSYDDLMDVLEPMMRFIGLHVSRDPVFLAKFLRLGRNHMSTTVSPLNLVLDASLMAYSLGRYRSRNEEAATSGPDASHSSVLVQCDAHLPAPCASSHSRQCCLHCGSVQHHASI